MKTILNHARFARNWLRDAGQQWKNRASIETDKALVERLAQTSDPGALYDMLRQTLPPHQISSEIEAFLQLASTRPHRVVGEIGLGEGGTHVLLGRALPSLKKLVGLDLFVRNRKRLRRLIRPGIQHQLLHGNSTDEQTIRRVRKFLNPDQFDILFIDGDHSRLGVQRDYELYSPMVKAGGLIVFHDIVPDHGKRFGRATTAWTGGVPDFWSKIKAGETIWEFIADPEQDGCGIGVLVHRAEAS